MNFPPKNWDEYDAYSTRVGEKLCLLIGVRTLPLLRSRHKHTLVHRPDDLHRFGSREIWPCGAELPTIMPSNGSLSLDVKNFSTLVFVFESILVAEFPIFSFRDLSNKKKCKVFFFSSNEGELTLL